MLYNIFRLWLPDFRLKNMTWYKEINFRTSLCCFGQMKYVQVDNYCFIIIIVIIIIYSELHLEYLF